MANGFETLGNALGGGTAPLRQQAFMQGQLAQANVGHLSAETQQALAAAQVAQQTATAAQFKQKNQESLADALIKGGMDPAKANMTATVMNAGGGNFEQTTAGQGNIQTQGFRSTLGDPNADPAARLAASSAIQGKPMSPYVAAPQESVNAFDPNNANPTAAPNVHDSPLGAALINHDVAQTALAKAQAANVGVAKAAKPPVGYLWNDPNDPSQGVTPIKGSKADPNAPSSMGSRESTYFQRKVNSAQLGVADMQNLVNSPTGSTSGLLGVGAVPGHSIFESLKGNLINKLAPQEVQDYNSIITGLSRNLATVEMNGLASTEHFANSFNALQLRDGDTESTKMGKLAQMRQIVDKGFTSDLTNPRVSEAQKATVRDIIDQVHAAIPFTREDVIALQRSKNPQESLKDVMARNGLSGDKTSSARSFSTEAEAEAAGLAPGTRVTIGGVSGTWH